MPAGALFHFDQPDDLRRVRDVLDAAGYNDKGVVELLGSDISASLGAKRLPALLRRTAGGTALEVLVRLFILGVAVDRQASQAGLAPLTPEWWAERGLVEIEGEEVRATVQLRCYQGLVVAFDFHRRGGEALRSDYVMGISPSSLALAGMTVRRPGRSALDLGTGSGFQALLAAQHCERVVATDLNPRAVEIARFNAGLNGLGSVECREGSLFEPVEGERFDLIVSNPPFIVSPDNQYYFLHSGMQGDEVCRTIVEQAPGLLHDGAFCQLLANWVVSDDQAWDERLAGWFEGTGCDGWVLRRGSQTPEEYALVWIETNEREGEELGRSFDAWMDYYDGLGVRAIDSGLITLRRSDRSGHWFRADEAPETMSFPCGDDVARTFDLQDFLATVTDDRALLATALRLSPDVRLDQRLEPTGGGWDALTTHLRRTEGLHFSGGIDPHGARVLAGCDGSRPLGELLAGSAAELQMDLDVIAPQWLAIVRALVQKGFLLPA